MVRGSAVKVQIDTEPVSGPQVLRHLARLAPMLFMAGVLTVAATVVSVAIAVVVVATGRVPERLAAFQVQAIRQRVRTFSGFFFLRPDTPLWPSDGSFLDPGDDARVRVDIEVPSCLPRLAPLKHAARSAMHLTVLVPLAIGLDLLYPVWLIIVVRSGWGDRTRSRLALLEEWTADVLAHAWLVSPTPPRSRWKQLTQPDPSHPQTASA
jgi:hypothetical protein